MRCRRRGSQTGAGAVASPRLARFGRASATDDASDHDNHDRRPGSEPARPGPPPHSGPTRSLSLGGSGCQSLSVSDSDRGRDAAGPGGGEPLG